MNMSSHYQPVDRNQPSSHRSLSENAPTSSISLLPPIKHEASLTQQLLRQPSSDDHDVGPSLFTNLLLNRKQVYGDRSATSLDSELGLCNLEFRSTRNGDSPLPSVQTDAEPYIPPEDLDVDLVLNELLSMAPVGKTKKKRGRPSKQSAALKQKAPSPRARECATRTSSRINAAKRRKTGQNSSRKLDTQEPLLGESNKTMARADNSEEPTIIEISDGEYEEPKLKPNPKPRHTLVARLGQSFSKACGHAQELQRLREEIAASKREFVAANATAEAARAETEATRTLLHTKDEVIKVSEKRIDDQATSLRSMQSTVETLQTNLREVRKERDQCQARSEEHKRLVVDHDLAIAELKDTQSRFQALERKSNVAEKEQAKVVHSLTERLLSTEAVQVPQSSQGNPPSSFASNFRQRTRPATPPATPTFSNPLGSSIAPSASPFRSTASVDEQKTEGVRRMYVKIKRKYDHLHSVLINLETCTRSMNLSSFGEFGRSMKQVRAALEEDGREQ